MLTFVSLLAQRLTYLLPLLICCNCNTNTAVAKVFEGDLYLRDQAEVNAFDFTEVTGNLLIGSTDYPSDITDLSSFSRLKSIGGGLRIAFNFELKDVAGFPELTSLGGDIHIFKNGELASISGFGKIRRLPYHLEIYNNISLTTLTGFPQLTNINGNLSISQNGLQSIKGFAKLNSVNGQLQIVRNYFLTDLSGLAQLSSIGEQLVISNNNILELCCPLLPLLDEEVAINEKVTIQYNAVGCRDIAEIRRYCDE